MLIQTLKLLPFVTAVFTLCGLLIAAIARKPIVTAVVKTHPSGDEGPIFYDLFVKNSGAYPAKDIRVDVCDVALNSAFGSGATEFWKDRVLACFSANTPLLVNGESLCIGSFGFTDKADTGVWKYNAILPIIVRYKGWFRLRHRYKQTLQITDSDTVTGYSWGATKSSSLSPRRALGKLRSVRTRPTK
jgi:hypothetical protein